MHTQTHQPTNTWYVLSSPTGPKDFVVLSLTHTHTHAHNLIAMPGVPASRRRWWDEVGVREAPRSWPERVPAYSCSCDWVALLVVWYDRLLELWHRTARCNVEKEAASGNCGENKTKWTVASEVTVQSGTSAFMAWLDVAHKTEYLSYLCTLDRVSSKRH